MSTALGTGLQDIFEGDQTPQANKRPRRQYRQQEPAIVIDQMQGQISTPLAEQQIGLAKQRPLPHDFPHGP